MPAKRRPPSFQFYPKDHITDDAVSRMTHDEHGRYMRYLCATQQTDKPGISTEDDVRLWADYSEEEWKLHRAAFARAFHIRKRDGMWIQKRTVAQRSVQRKHYQRSKEGGRRSASRPRDSRGRLVGGLDQGLDAGVGTPSSTSASASSSAILQNPTPQPLPSNHVSAPPGRRGQRNQGTRSTRGAASGKAGFEAFAAAVGRAIPGASEPDFESDDQPLTVEFVSAKQARFPGVEVFVVAAQVKDEQQSGEVRSLRGLFMHRCKMLQERASARPAAPRADRPHDRPAGLESPPTDSDSDGEGVGA